ncbi:MAG: MBL fold metallo-hydrolase [Rickettsiales bacterium]|nr:MBL fold metallo-hydrolase [Rickettsiales bacterium]
MLRSLKICFIFCFFLIVSCGAPDLDYPKSDHFDGEVFHNLNEAKSQKSFKAFLKWRFTSKREKWPDWVEIEQQKIKTPRNSKGDLSVTFINHATLLIQFDGVNILSDPVYSKRTSPLTFAGPKRVKKPGVKFDDLPKIDIIIISHNHYDSFDVRTLERLIKRDNPVILFGLGSSYYLDEEFRTKNIEMDWQDEYVFNGVKFVFLPAKHWSKRGFSDLNKSLWGAFAIIGSKQIYFASDTGYSDHFKNAQKQFDEFDLALIPIGAYEPRWFMKQAHINPEEAVIAHQDLKSKKSIAMHFGTFQLTNEAIDDPEKDLQKAKTKYGINDDEFVVLKEGESLIIN